MTGKEYIEPVVEVHEMRIECLLDVSTGGSLEGTRGNGTGSGMEADSNVDAWSDGLW